MGNYINVMKVKMINYQFMVQDLIDKLKNVSITWKKKNMTTKI